MDVLFVLVMSSFACGVLGPFLLLRKLSMTADALSHSVLLGIVLAFFLVKDLDSPLLSFGAAVFGFITVLAVEYLSKHKKVQKEDALGIVFPMFFALAVVLITKYFRNTHIDVEIVLMGNPLFAPFLRWAGLPKSLVEMGILFVINLSFVLVFYQSLKMATFDEGYAKLQGLSFQALFYGLMILTSFTCVKAFDSVGAILVISFFIAPSACAYLVAKSLKQMMLWTLGFGLINSVIGYYLGMAWNLSISGMCSFVGMVTCFVVLLVHKKGWIYRQIQMRSNRKELEKNLVLMHVYRHYPSEKELGFETIHEHLNWTMERSQKILQELVAEERIVQNFEKKQYQLSEQGFHCVQLLLGKSGHK